MAAVAANVSGLFANIRDPGARVRELCAYACKVEVDNEIPTKLYLRSGLEMLRMAKVYQEEGNLESAFVLYTKFISLFVEKLPKHPDYKASPPTELSNIRKKVKLVFPLAEEIKSKLLKSYSEIEKKRKEEERKQQEELEREQERIRLEQEARQKEEQEEQERYRIEVEAKWLQEQEERLREIKEQEMMKNIDQERKDERAGIFTDTQEGLNNQKPAIPSGTGSLAFIPNNLGDARKMEKNLINDPTRAQSLPLIPDRELKKNLVINDSQEIRPDVDRSSKPDLVDHFTCIGVSGGNKGGLRDLMVPSDLMRKFLTIAEHNTLKHVETCGILAGKLSQNAFSVTHVLVPKQTGTSDSCVAEDEEEIFEYQDPRDLITLGWIHTHPTQTAFLSSVDMHNQYGYQAMMPEAIAIVCAPKFHETGFFTLTQDRGLVEIGRCRERGFHEHTKVPPLFENGSHIRIVDNYKIEMVDLRNK